MGPDEAGGLVLVMMLSCLGLRPDRVGVFLARSEERRVGKECSS